MGTINVPGIPEADCPTTQQDPQLRELLIAIKVTLEQLLQATPTELDTFLNKNL